MKLSPRSHPKDKLGPTLLYLSYMETLPSGRESRYQYESFIRLSSFIPIFFPPHSGHVVFFNIASYMLEVPYGKDSTVSHTPTQFPLSHFNMPRYILDCINMFIFLTFALVTLIVPSQFGLLHFFITLRILAQSSRRFIEVPQKLLVIELFVHFGLEHRQLIV